MRQAEQRTGGLAEELHRVLSKVLLVFGRRDPVIIAASDLTLSQLSILSALSEAGPMRLNELAAHERVQPPTITVCVRRLEKLGLVTRLSDPEDQRVVLVERTPRGDAVRREALAARCAALAAMLTALNREDRETLCRALPALERLAEQGHT
ncbi:MarR family winged helix-turn-helix transcriptional regulator [Mycobacterium branderi]|uniref:MarR family transcriptional regulator n=1 Tax=Mycobacterium branderi TaxID=43348 RepID=A0A7I7WCW8_9MYCO|nr:MarR family transcriptional regulator [Mycobacterium branderi]MCV7234599.1 MarR family transcriptional regulator [Mycobacterium branderi]ORA33146.1 MarR family transcriptional regulator [Mycobacterium branderi]BBZ15386.1 hypothetical protein MBRA_55810 [Mycobacterium branderi]